MDKYGKIDDKLCYELPKITYPKSFPHSKTKSLNT